MKRMAMSFLSLLVAACATAQPPVSTASVTEAGRIDRFVAGPGDRPMGALLRNGTFVTFSPGIAQRLPASLSRSARIEVVGERFSYGGNKTIQARSVTIAGVAYNDDGPMPAGPNTAGGPRDNVATPPPPAPAVPPAPGALQAPPPPPGPPAPSARRAGPRPQMAVGAPPPPPAAPGGSSAPGTPSALVGPAVPPVPPVPNGSAVPPPPAPVPADGAPAAPVPPVPAR